MRNAETVIVGLKRELKETRARVRFFKEQNDRWQQVGATLRKLAGLDEDQYRNLLCSESLSD